MPNSNTPRGLVPVRSGTSGAYNGGANRYYVPATNPDALFVGDPVAITGEADAAGTSAVSRASVTGGFTGVIVGFEPISERQNPNHLAALTEGYLIVADDPALECVIQASGTLTSADIGLNAGFVFGAGNTAYGTSGTQLDVATKGVGTTLPIKITGVHTIPDNALGEDFTKVTVRLNNSSFVGKAGGV